MTFIAGLRLDRISAPWIIDDPINVRIRRGPQGRSVLDGTADDRQAASAATFCRCQFQGRSS
jgi:hypothetical protein